MIERIFQFLNTHFEQILAVNLFWFIAIVVIVVVIRVREIRLRHVQKFVRSVLFYIMIGGQCILLSLAVMIYVMNWEQPLPDISAHIESSTGWVKEDLTVYIICDNKLVSRKADGSRRQTVAETDSPLREYHFSPDGRQILLVTGKSVLLYNGKDRSLTTVDSLDVGSAGSGGKGVITGIQWAPDSRKFCYRVAKWSAYSSQDQWYLYDVPAGQKRAIQSRAYKISALVWDKTGENLYDLWFEAQDTTVAGHPYLVKIYRVPLATLQPELAIRFPSLEPTLPPEHLAITGIELYAPAHALSFGHTEAGPAETGRRPRIGIDQSDALYYVPAGWWHKRLYRIPRVPVVTDLPRYQYKGGDLAVGDMRWLPSGKYVMMEHYFFGILILEPASGRVGILDNQKGHTFGWYK